MEPIDFKKNILIAALLANLALIFISYFKSKKTKANKAWVVVIGTVILWIISMIIYRGVGPENSLFWSRLLYISASLIPLFFLHFCFLYPEDKRPIAWKVKWLMVLPTFLIISGVIFPEAIIKEIVIKPLQEKTIIFGPLYFLYVLYISGYFSLALWNLFQKYLKASGYLKAQLTYVLLGTSISIILGSTFNLILPWFGNFQFNWLGQVTTLFMVSSISYGILKYRLFEIKVFLTEFLVMLIAIILLIQAIWMENPWLKFLNASVFGLFLIFGYFLIKSVINEIEYRQKLELAYQEVEKLSKAKSEFISIASHQIRTPLTAIKGYISMILEGSYGKLVDRVKTPLENVYKSNERLINLVNDLLSISRIESGKMELELEKSSIEEIVMGVVDDLKITAEKKNLYLKLEKPTEPLPKIMLDKDKMRQVILNLVDNAIKYTRKGGITINTKVIDSGFQILVKDTGGGMSKEDLVKLFESFSRGIVGAQSYNGGTGLGLYIAKRFVEMHNGRIRAESDGIDKGSSFFIELPIN